MNNPKLSSKESAEGLKFIFKPTLDIRDRKGLVRLLRSYNSLGSGGIRMDDVEESLPNALKAIKVSQHFLPASLGGSMWAYRMQPFCPL